ncbi:MAG: superoxide dismutase family protein [Rhodospirillales bacterium]|nr:superoxide dismutase family protein [Rhodospirillales bacterium]
MAGVALVGLTSGALAATKTVTMHAISTTGVGNEIGTITFQDTRYGLFAEPKLTGLQPPGSHGFHVHENGNCSPGTGPNGQPAAGLAAGGHYDPNGTKKHRGPGVKDSHLGDMPVLIVDPNGTATLPVLAAQLKVKDLAGRAIMIHVGGDNYDDTPAALGGGGGRIACGVIE